MAPLTIWTGLPILPGGPMCGPGGWAPWLARRKGWMVGDAY